MFNLTAVDVKGMNKDYVNSASSHISICFLFSVEAHSSFLCNESEQGGCCQA